MTRLPTCLDYSTQKLFAVYLQLVVSAYELQR